MQRGFTLIELLVVIAILAVLATTVVLVLNPAELLRQGRDSTRISDIAALNNAIAFYIADGNTSWTASANGNCTAGTVAPTSGSSATTCTNSNSSSTAVNGTGWVPVNFSAISSGSPLPKLPLDPNNGSSNCSGAVASTTICAYIYKASTTITGGYKIMANMESTKYTTSGSADAESNTKDGGTVDTWYELGSNLSL